MMPAPSHSAAGSSEVSLPVGLVFADQAAQLTVFWQFDHRCVNAVAKCLHPLCQGSNSCAQAVGAIGQFFLGITGGV